MSEDGSTIHRLQILLHEDCRSGEARAKARRAIEEAGLSVSGEGQVSLSARVSDEEFARLFPDKLLVGGEFRVPESLKAFVVPISESPRHLYFE